VLVKALKSSTKLNYIYICLFIFSPYRAVNTLRLGYTNQSVNAV
jgi:hypothetical protein